MKSVTLIVFCTYALVVLNSCSSSRDDLPEQNEIKYLTSYFTRDSQFPAGSFGDTVSKGEVNYDSQGRVIRIDETSRGFLDGDKREERFYFGNDTLPYKIIYQHEGYSITETTFIWYQNGRVVKDSTFTTANNEVTIKRFNWSNPEKLTMIEDTYEAGALKFSDSSIIQRLGAGSNVINCLDSAFITHPYYQPRGPVSYRVKLDNKTNPFRYFQGGYPLLFMRNTEDVGYGIGKGFPLNNVLQMEFDRYTQFNHTITYTYSTDGYPLISASDILATYTTFYKYSR